MRFSALFLLATLFCSGCVVPGSQGAGGSQAYDGVAGINPQASACIARYAANHLSEIYPPGRTSLSFDADTHFGEALEDAARKRGFAVGLGGLPVGYTLDMLSEQSCYLSLSLPDGVITQSFTLNGYSDVNAAIPDYTCTKTGLLAFSESACRPLADYQLESDTALPQPLPPRIYAGASSPLPTVRHEPIQAEAAQPEQMQITPKEEAGSVAQTTALAVATPSAPIEIKPTPPAAQSALEAKPETATAIYEPEPVPVALVEAPLPSWSMSPGLLRPQLEAWAETAGYSVVWNAKRDFEMETSAHFAEDFVNTLHSLFLQMHQQGTPLRVTVYQGNNVVEITEE